ncbi:DEAD/DEAH box helicase, partial [Candidatus Bipolaricaulota bacterium]|nr:DEAD/DEAH box helicase [Candidatus Bipolaricaulota bacterium]
MQDDVLHLFHPATARWFRESFAEPTLAQLQGWPRIAAQESTLILAPTGSGKTLAAFLYAIDELIQRAGSGVEPRGVHTLYLSPLKALANDIERNLDPPLEGIRACAERQGIELPEIRVGLRTGDTPPAERQRMVSNPPDLLITTPESLHLLLTSLKAREMLRTVRYVIVDEIHALCPNKRGTFLAILLERLEALVERPTIRIGLSATQRPLDAVARFLGGYNEDGTPRPVAIVDAGMRKTMDLAVVSPVDDMKDLPRAADGTLSVWPAIYERLLDFVNEHTSTLIFANSRRVVERIAAEINRLAGAPLARAHHGSVSKEERHRIEQDLKAGRLPALVATASMELGIDVGAIDLVCQVEAPFSVASGLQRIGRAGHLVRATSVGRVLPKTRADLLVSAAIARQMLRGEISTIHIPRHPLDMLAQQIVAMVAMDEWTVDDLYQRVRCAAPYRELPREAYLSVLELLSGRYQTPAAPVLRPRISWERSVGRLYPLPGSRQMVALNGGAIPDTGQYAMVLEDGTSRIGELDEEFVFERRLGETFVLGTGRWRIVEIRHDRVVVAPTEEREVIMPFWKGEGLGRDAEFGERYGVFLRECEERMGGANFEGWLESECALDQAAAANLAAYLADQRADGVIPNDRRILIDVFRNETDDLRVSLVSPFGRAFHHGLLLGIQAALRARGREQVDAIFSGDGVLFRPGRLGAEALVDVIRHLDAERIVDDIIGELAHSPFFALRFRRNAGRAQLLPRARPGRRTPLWLQRLRAHDLLAVAAQHPGFPIVAETYREIIDDELPLEAVQRFLRQVDVGEAAFVVRKDRGPSPFTTSLLLDFTGKYLYEEDRPAPTDRPAVQVRDDIASLFSVETRGADLLDPEAIRTMEERLQGLDESHRARDGAELVELLRRLGGLTEGETIARCEQSAIEALPDLLEDGRILRVTVKAAAEPERLVAADDADAMARMNGDDVREFVRRYIKSHALVTHQQVTGRFPTAADAFDELVQAEGWVRVERSDGGVAIAAADVVAGIRRLSIASQRRRFGDPVSPEAFARFLLEHQRLQSPVRRDETAEILDQLVGVRLPVRIWPQVLRGRIAGFREATLSDLVGTGQFAWYGDGGAIGQRAIGFAPQALLSAIRPMADGTPEAALGRAVLAYLESHGASFLQPIARALEASPSDIATALWELTWLGRATNDSLAPAFGSRPRPAMWDGRKHGGWGSGRWSALPALPQTQSAADVRAVLEVLLHRYGVLSRELVVRDGMGVRWADAYPLLSRMEWAGDVERGLFVSGLSTPQFATRAAIDGLRAPDSFARPILLHVSDP